MKIDYELTAAEAELLKGTTEDALAAAGAVGGEIGAGGAGEAAARKGGASGGRLGARFTKAQSAETTVEVPHDPDAAREHTRTAIAEAGEVIDDPNAADDGSVWGIVGSGAMNMVPALVRVQAEALGSGGSRVHVRATGREGLIKQKIGAKAADRIAEAVSRPR